MAVLERRIEKLETRSGLDPVLVVLQHPGESEADATARALAEQRLASVEGCFLILVRFV